MKNKHTGYITTNVDKSLIKMFLEMTIEKRLKSNDNAVQTILELRNAFNKQKPIRNKP